MPKRVERFDAKANMTKQIFSQNRGWSTFVAVQSGITAMYAGDFRAAIIHFTRARAGMVDDELLFLRRDAIVKTALIEALYGDVARAEALLAEASTLPHCGSWVELEIDAAHIIAESQLPARPARERLEALRAIPLHHFGELWPFYLVALQRRLLVAGETDEAKHHLMMFEQMQLTQTEGEGFTGSAISLSATLDALLEGDFTEASARLERADPGLLVTQLMHAALDLAVGRPRAALQRASDMRDRTRTLRVLNVWRLATMAGGHLLLRDEDSCREVLEFILQLPGGLRETDLIFFPQQLRAFASAHVAGWPESLQAPLLAPGLFPTSGETLTQRELDILYAIAQGGSRESIARAQYISVNTLKAHLRSIYRKLGVNSRTAAVLEAERRRLV